MDEMILILVGVVGLALGALINQIINNFLDKRKPNQAAAEQEFLLALRREPGTDHLVVNIDGKETDSSYLLDKKRRDHAQRLILELNRWLEPAEKNRGETGMQPSDQAGDRDQAETEENLPRPSLNPVTVLVRALQADVKKSQLPTESIVPQINDILQVELKNAPHIKDPVRLMEWPGLGMVVMIGLDKYDSVDDVPDEDIKIIIRDAVRKWEQQGLQKK